MEVMRQFALSNATTEWQSLLILSCQVMTYWVCRELVSFLKTLKLQLQAILGEFSSSNLLNRL